MNTCREPGCERTDLFGRGLCGRHYQFYRYHNRLDEVAPRPADRTCSHCGAQIKAKLRQWASEFCSSRCAHLAKYQPVEQKNERCLECDGLIVGRRPQAAYCSDACATKHRQRKMAVEAQERRVPCVHCGTTIPPRARRFCSRTCTLAHRRPEKYGLTRDELAALLAQHDVCAICRTDNWGRKGPQVDHDHVTGAVRGVLCSNCNTLLGHAKDDPDLLRAAVEYLAR